MRLQPNLKKSEHEQQIHQVKQNHLSKKKKSKTRTAQRQQPTTTETSGPLQKRLNNTATATPRAVDGEIKDSLAQIGDWRHRDGEIEMRTLGNIKVFQFCLFFFISSLR